MQWYGVVFLLPVAILGTAITLLHAFGVSLDWAARPKFAQTAGLLLLFVVLPVGAPLAEEVAWRGFALPRLLHRRSPVIASLILGVIWAAWHIPVVVSDPALRVPFPFFSSILSLSIISTWLYLRTGGSVLILVLFHAWYDVLLGFVAQMVSRNDYALLWWLIFAVQSVPALPLAYVLRNQVKR